MWNGPYGDHGSRKYLIASLDQSLKRMGLEYVDIFYHHRPDPDTPMEETASALDHIVRSGKALYVGISNYNAEQTKQMAEIMKSLGTPLVIHQPRYNMFERWIENGLQDVLQDEGIGSISFCPLAQGLLTNKYINGIPADSRAAKSSPFLTKEGITADKIEKIVKLNKIAENRGQSLAQMACAWNLRGGKLTSVLLGASKASQIIENVNSLNNLDFTQDELNAIEDSIEIIWQPHLFYRWGLFYHHRSITKILKYDIINSIQMKEGIYNESTRFKRTSIQSFPTRLSISNR